MNNLVDSVENRLISFCKRTGRLYWFSPKVIKELNTHYKYDVEKAAMHYFHGKQDIYFPDGFKLIVFVNSPFKLIEETGETLDDLLPHNILKQIVFDMENEL